MGQSHKLGLGFRGFREFRACIAIVEKQMENTGNLDSMVVSMDRVSRK